MRVDERLLATWPLPEPGGDKRARGDIVVVGGGLRSPGAALLAGEAALRVGAGRLTLALSSSVAPAAATALPECGVVPLEATAGGGIVGASIGRAGEDLAGADAVLVGPGLDDVEETIALLERLPDLLADDTMVVLDAFALGAVSTRPELAEPFRGRAVFTPNTSEAAMLLGRDLEALDEDAAEIARRFAVAVSCFGVIAGDRDVWTVDSDNPGLGTSGSGDVLAGAVAGLCARGASPAQAAVWGTWVHSEAGALLARDVGPLGFLAHEILMPIPAILARP